MPTTHQVLAVDTIPNMLLIDKTVSPTVIVQKDGTGGTFNYDAEKSAVNNGVTIFDGWVRELKGAVTPQMAGAKGDNSTDDLTAINNTLAVSTNIDFGDSTYYVSAMPDFSAGHIIEPTTATIRVASGQHTASNLNVKNAGGLTISGDTIVSTTLSNISSRSGVKGAWSLTGTVADASEISEGDVIRIKDVLPGVLAPGLINSRPVRGQMHMIFFKLGEISVTGVTATVSGSGVNTYLATSDLVLIKGQLRKIASIISDTQFTISSALAKDVAGLQYWYYFDNIPAGLCSASGKKITCSGAYFDNFVEVGSFIGLADAGIRRVVSVDSDTECTVDNEITATSKVWGVVDTGENHEGAWIITNVDGNEITWTNTIQTDQGIPPIKNFTSANIDIIKTKLNFEGNGATVEDGTLVLTNVALVGDGTGYGVDVRANKHSGKAILDINVSIINFAYGVRANNSAAIYGQEVQIMDCTSRGADITEGGCAWLQKATFSGNTGIGLFVGPGSYARLSDVRINGNSAQGLRMEVGSSVWCDFGYISSNGADSVLVVGGVNGHFVGTRVLKNTGDGIEGQNGLYGRGSGILCIGNGGAGVRVATGQFEINQATLIGNGSYGAVITGGHVKLNEASTSGNASAGILILEGGIVSANTFQSTNEKVAIICQDEGVVRGNGVGFAGNETDAYSARGGKINLSDSGSFSTNIPKNTVDISFGYIADGTSAPL